MIVKVDIHVTNKTSKYWEVVYVINKARQLFSKHSQCDCFVSLVDGGTNIKNSVVYCAVK